MQSNCAYSDFGTIHVSAMLPFMLYARKENGKLRFKVFTPSLHSLLIIKEDVILTCQRG